MGYLREKYTKEYFTGKDEDGNSVGYGATMSVDQNGDLVLREHDQAILDQVNFQGRATLGLGIGRGEELCYAVEQGASFCIGVDFSAGAISIAEELLKTKKHASVKLVNEDALAFLKDYVKIDNYRKFDVIIMFDFVEHVPRNELGEILDLLKRVLSDHGILVINTPAYKFDNDVMKDGFDKRNLGNCLDQSDIIEATQGMHCNKFTVVSLQSFMRMRGYDNVTEMHFFVSNQNVDTNFNTVSYAERWNYIFSKGYPVKQQYIDDVVEYPYSDALKLERVTLEEGMLQGVSLYTTAAYATIAYGQGNIDVQMFEDARSFQKIDKAVIFDIGACVGVDSLVFAKIVGVEGRIVAFEPNEHNLNRFFINLGHNQFSYGKIAVFPYALGDKQGKIKMNVSANIDEGHSSTSRVYDAHSKIKDSALPEGFYESTVDVVTLDDFVKRTGIVPDILKIDIEGAEHIMLEGAVQTLNDHKPQIYMELHSEYCALVCFKILHSLNYSVTIIHEEDDNRLMVKAVCDEERKQLTHEELMVETQRNLDANFELIKQMHLLSKESIEINKQLRLEMSQLREDNNNFQETIERMRRLLDTTQNENIQMSQNMKNIQVEIERIKGSSSWKLTRPLRRLKRLMNE